MVTWDAIPDELGRFWSYARRFILVPVLRVAVVLCLIMSVVLLIEKTTMGTVSLFVKVFRRKPEKIYKWQSLEVDEELSSEAFPRVLVQIPMFNEGEVVKIS